MENFSILHPKDMTMKKINFGARPIDLDRLALIRALCPDVDNTTDAIRLALLRFESSSDPVAVEAARKQARKAGKK